MGQNFLILLKEVIDVLKQSIYKKSKVVIM